VPSLILAAMLAIMGLMLWTPGLIGDLQAVNRKLLEDIQVRAREAALAKPSMSRQK